MSSDFNLPLVTAGELIENSIELQKQNTTISAQFANTFKVFGDFSQAKIRWI